MGRQAQTGLTARLQPGEGLQNPKRPVPYFRTHGQSRFQAPFHGLHARNEKSETERAKRVGKRGQQGCERLNTRHVSLFYS
mgnify:CR=1 FL=1